MSQREKQKSRHFIDPRWYEVTNYSDLLQLGAEYVTGILSETPTYGKALTVEFPGYRQKLLQLHKYGIYTVDGQESWSRHNFYTETRCFPEQNQEHKVWVDDEQKGYLCFFVDLIENGKLAESLCRQLSQSNLHYSYYNFITKETTTNIHNELGSVIVTRCRYNQDPNELANTKWINYTYIHAVMGSKECLSYCYDATSKSILEHTMYFSVAVPKYSEGDLESQLLDMCKTADGKIYTFCVKKYA